MRRCHFQTIAPVCPRCKSERGEDHALTIAHIEREEGEHILEGVLHCPHAECRLEYPIIDGLPFLLTPLREHVQQQFESIMARDDLGETTEGMLGDALGPGTIFDTTRLHLSSYAWDHYAEFDPDEPQTDPRPGSTMRMLQRGLALLDAPLAPPLLELGCATGRGVFELAGQSDGLVLGVDLNISMLRTAARVLRTGRVRYGRRREGIIYDRREFDVEFPGADQVDFWVCDAMTPPFADNVFGGVVGLNVLDSVASPVRLLESMDRVAAPGASALLGCPYDWSVGVTPLEGWIGGHSQRGEDEGSAALRLRRLFDPQSHPQAISGWRIVGEADSVPWHVRAHARSFTEYAAHLLALRKQTDAT